MTFDYKKEYKEYYLPPQKPTIVDVPKMNFIAVYGKGNPNDKDGDYQHAIESLYAIAYTIKMSKRTNYHINGYFDYVVPPLEGFWWQDEEKNNYTYKENFQWISIIRLPDFVTEKDVNWAKKEATHKKKKDFSNVQFLTYNEGICVQCLHVGSYDDEPTTIQMMEEHIMHLGYQSNITNHRFHHEIYLSDPRRVKPEKLKTIIRIPICKY